MMIGTLLDDLVRRSRYLGPIIRCRYLRFPTNGPAHLVLLSPVPDDHIIPLAHAAFLDPETISYSACYKLGTMSSCEEQSREDDREVGIAQVLPYKVRANRYEV